MTLEQILNILKEIVKNDKQSVAILKQIESIMLDIGENPTSKELSTKWKEWGNIFITARNLERTLEDTVAIEILLELYRIISARDDITTKEELLNTLAIVIARVNDQRKIKKMQSKLSHLMFDLRTSSPSIYGAAELLSLSLERILIIEDKNRKLSIFIREANSIAEGKGYTIKNVDNKPLLGILAQYFIAILEECPDVNLKDFLSQINPSLHDVLISELSRIVLNSDSNMDISSEIKLDYLENLSASYIKGYNDNPVSQDDELLKEICRNPAVYTMK